MAEPRANPTLPSPESDRRFLTPRVRLSRAISAFMIRHAFRGAGLVRSQIARLLTPAPSGPVVVPTTLGFHLLVDPTVDRGVEWDVYYHGIYEAGTLHVLRHVLRPGDSFVDVGANVGLMTLAAAAAVGRTGRVYAFEPLHSVFEMLMTNIALNGATNVEAYPIALGAMAEDRALYENLDRNRASASLVDPGTTEPVAVVKVQTLDGFLEHAHVRAVRAVKVDVEGWESQVLLGARELLSHDAAPALIVEYSTAVPVGAGQRKDLYDLLTSVNDYRVFKLEKRKDSISRLRPIRGDWDLPQHDNLFCFRPAHLRESLPGLFADA